MAEYVEPSETIHPVTEPESKGPSLIWRLLPYLVMIVIAVIGVAFSDMYPQSARSTWRLVAVLYGIIAIVHVFVREGDDKMKRALVQVAHWGALIVAMFIINTPMVERLVSDDVTGIVLLQLLALATFLDGLYVDWRLCIVGVMLMLGAAFLAFLDQAAVSIAIIGVVAVVALFFLRKVTSDKGVAPST
ncbi:MAG: hypothetical protein U1E45_10120 [Geminicoccaceae bacterium]